MNRPINRIISFLTSAVYVWLYAIVIYFTLSNRMLFSISGNATRFFDVFFLGDGSEGALGNFFVAVFAVMLLKTAVSVLQKDISRQSKIRILSMNIIYLLCLCIFAFFLGNTAGFAVFAIISAAVLILAVYVNFAGTPIRARSASPNTTSKVLCALSVAVHILSGAGIISVSFANAKLIGSTFGDSPILWLGLIGLITLLRAVYFAVRKPSDEASCVKTLVCSSFILPTAVLAFSDFGASAIIAVLKALPFFICLAVLIYTQIKLAKSTAVK